MRQVGQTFLQSDNRDKSCLEMQKFGHKGDVPKGLQQIPERVYTFPFFPFFRKALVSLGRSAIFYIFWVMDDVGEKSVGIDVCNSNSYPSLLLPNHSFPGYIKRPCLCTNATFFVTSKVYVNIVHRVVMDHIQVLLQVVLVTIIRLSK